MLPNHATFPFPGSLALREDGTLWRIFRHNQDGSVQICRNDKDMPRTGHIATGHISVDITTLTDPGSRIAARPYAPLALRLAAHLRDADDVLFTDAIDAAQLLIGEHRLPLRHTPALVRTILTELGWHETRRRGRVVFLRSLVTMEQAA